MNGITECLEGLAGAIGAQSQPVRAAQLLGAAAALRETMGMPRPPADEPIYAQIMARACAGLDELRACRL